MMIKLTKKSIGKCFIAAGLLLIISALCMCIYNFYSDIRAERLATAAADNLKSVISKEDPFTNDPDYTPAYIDNPDIEMPIEKLDGDYYIGILTIPKLGLELPVIGDWNYKNLKKSPCCYSGSAYESGFVICAHNYRSHFGRLDSLDLGDRVQFVDIDGNVFDYKVSAFEILPPEAIEEMTDEVWDLTLFTCTIGGGSRRTLRCDKIS